MLVCLYKLLAACAHLYMNVYVYVCVCVSCYKDGQHTWLIGSFTAAKCQWRGSCYAPHSGKIHLLYILTWLKGNFFSLFLSLFLVLYLSLFLFTLMFAFVICFFVAFFITCDRNHLNLWLILNWFLCCSGPWFLSNAFQSTAGPGVVG